SEGKAASRLESGRTTIGFRYDLSAPLHDHVREAIDVRIEPQSPAAVNRDGSVRARLQIDVFAGPNRQRRRSSHDHGRQRPKNVGGCPEGASDDTAVNDDLVSTRHRTVRANGAVHMRSISQVDFGAGPKS